MIRLGISSDLDKLVSKLENVRRDQLPFATAKAITATAQIAKQRLVEEMPKAFDRPTPYSLNSLFLRPATKASLSALIWLKDDAGKGTPAAKYLLPQIAGGQRRPKRFERALQMRGLLPPGRYALPGSAAKMDAYGNMNRGQIVQILSALGAAETRSGFLANRTAASKKRKGGKRPEFFVGSPGNGKLPMGVWQRFTFGHGSAIKPVLIFPTKTPHYTQRYRFQEIADLVVKTEFASQFSAAYQQAIATAR